MDVMSQREGTSTDLGGFLHACRSRISPEEAGVTVFGDRRRVAGLRREELAILAGVSVSYYTRLEQGQSRNASPQVIDALASALRLDATEVVHLRRLASAPSRVPKLSRPPLENADPFLMQLLDAMPDIPSLVIGRRGDVLAWNRLGHALIASHLELDAPCDRQSRPNMTRQVFLDDHTRDLYDDWELKATAVVGNLRLTVASHPTDADLAELIGAMSMASSTFSVMWSDQRVEACATATYAFNHPLVGRISLLQQTLRSANSPEQSLVTHTASPGSRDEETLRLLAVASAGTPTT